MKILLLILLSICFYDSNALGYMGKEYNLKQIQRAAIEEKVPPKLLAAVCWGESLLKSDAFREGDGGNKNHAFGQCQVTLNTAKGMGFIDKNDQCKDFKQYTYENGNKIINPKTFTSCELFGPYTNAKFAAKYLKSRLVRYQDNWSNAVAAYNSGTLRMCPSSGWVTGNVVEDGKVVRKRLYKCRRGGIMNQPHVDRVMRGLVVPEITNMDK